MQRFGLHLVVVLLAVAGCQQVEACTIISGTESEEAAWEAEVREARLSVSNSIFIGRVSWANGEIGTVSGRFSLKPTRAIRGRLPLFPISVGEREVSTCGGLAPSYPIDVGARIGDPVLVLGYRWPDLARLSGRRGHALQQPSWQNLPQGAGSALLKAAGPGRGPLICSDGRGLTLRPGAER